MAQGVSAGVLQEYAGLFAHSADLFGVEIVGRSVQLRATFLEADESAFEAFFWTSFVFNLPPALCMKRARRVCQPALGKISRMARPSPLWTPDMRS